MVNESTTQESDREIKKRPRPIISCLTCRQKKLKCDRLLPCQQCLKAGRAERCSYADGREPPLRDHTQTDGQAEQNRHSRHESSDSLQQYKDYEQADTISRISQHRKPAVFEQQKVSLTDQTAKTLAPSALIDDQFKHAEDRVRLCESLTHSQLQPFNHAYEFVRSLPAQHGDDDLRRIACSIRAIQGAVVFGRRHTTQAPLPHLADTLSHMRQSIPGYETSQTLIELYFENFEHCARIFHRQTFVMEVERFCRGSMTERDATFLLPQIFGVLAIAVSLNTIDECTLSAFQHTPGNVGPAQILQDWLSLLPFEDRLTVPALQVSLLLMLLRQFLGADERDLYCTSGNLVRQAMLMDLHRPSATSCSSLRSELRKRLWITIIEQDLALAIETNLPTNHLNFTIEPPLNVNDEELIDDSNAWPSSHAVDEWTDGLCQHVLAQSFGTRLEIHNLNIGQQLSVTYARTMEYAQELEQVIQRLPRTFKLEHTNPPGRLLAQMAVDVIHRRSLIMLYSPFAKQMPEDDRYQQARIGWVQANLVILCFQDLFDVKFEVIDVPRPKGFWDLYYALYGRDCVRGLRALLFELQRMKNCNQSVEDRMDVELGQHSHRQISNALGWSINGIIGSVADTIHPFERRVGEVGTDLDDLVRYSIVTCSLIHNGIEDKERNMHAKLLEIIENSLLQLQQQGINIILSAQADDLTWFEQFLHYKRPPFTDMSRH